MPETMDPNVKKRTFVKKLATTLFGLACFAATLAAQPKVVFPAQGLTTPIGIAYSPFVNRLLVTQPFCGTVVGNTSTGYNVTAIDANGNSTPFASLAPQTLSTNPLYGHSTAPFNACFEDYIAVSPGLGGFPANQVYVTQGQTIVSIPPGGGAPTTFVSGLPTTDTETGISFDTVGTFCNNMIVTSADGRISLVTSAGTVIPYATITSAVVVGTGGVAAESAVVAPMTFTPYPGWLLVGVEDSQNPAGPFVAAIQPPSACPISNVGTPQIFRISNQPSPEAVLSVPSTATSCEFGAINPRTSAFAGGTFFSVTYTGTVSVSNINNPYQIVAYRASGFTGKIGHIMVPNEDAGGAPTNELSPTGGAIGTMVTSTVFDPNTSPPTFVQQEGSTFVGCPLPPPTLGCVLTPGGYKNHFNYKVTGLTIGGTFYTAAQVTQIISTGGGGINALGRSLATAMLNIQYGAVAPQSVLDAITQANAAIKAVTTDVGKTIFQATLSNSIASPLNDILDAFNNGSAGQQECTQ